MQSSPSAPANLKAFHVQFPAGDEAACAAYLEALRWPAGFTCPKCGSPEVGRVHGNLIRCRNNHQVSVTSGTAMHRTKQRLWDWLLTAFLVSTSTTGVSALQLQKQLGLSRYETAFQLLHKLRSALVAPDREKLHGEVEVDEFHVSSPRAHLGRTGPHALVVSAVEVIRWTEDTPEGPVARSRCGRIRLSVIPDNRQVTLDPWVRANVAPGSRLVTDGHAGYNPLAADYAVERHVGYEYGESTGDHPVHTGRVVANFKAKLLGTYHGSVESKHLQAYLNEFAFRFNRRWWRGPAFTRCLQLLLNAEAQEYEELYAGPAHPEQFVYELIEEEA